MSAPDLSVRFAGLVLKTPVVLLSGCVGFGEDYARVEGFCWDAIGAVILKGTTLAPRLGNAPHRLAETPMGLLNAIGLQNPGARKVVEEILPRLPHEKTHFWANVNGASVEEYAEVATIFDDSPVTAMEVNISCPNVKAGGMHFGHDPKTAAQVVAAVKKRTNKPVIVKLSPNAPDFLAVARAVLEEGADALSAINTLVGMAVDIRTQRPVLANITGGLSGPAIKPIALWRVFQLRALAREYKVPILGQGGIASAEDAIAFALVGADAVGLGTGLFYDPLLPNKVVEGLSAYLAERNLARYADLVGALRVSA